MKVRDERESRVCYNRLSNVALAQKSATTNGYTLVEMDTHFWK
jgi:hypothetical protein